jgi:hypothetical protein
MPSPAFDKSPKNAPPPRVLQAFFADSPAPPAHPARPATVGAQPGRARANKPSAMALPAQRKAVDVHAVQPPRGFLEEPRQDGQPLPASVKQRMERYFAADFSDVRVYTGPEAASIGALAFTLGSDIYFSPEHYQPDTRYGQELLGHELTHVVQQREGRVENPYGTGVAVVQDHELEAEADRCGREAAQGKMRRDARLLEPSTAGRRLPASSTEPSTTIPELRPRGPRMPFEPASLPPHAANAAIQKKEPPPGRKSRPPHAANAAVQKKEPSGHKTARPPHVANAARTTEPGAQPAQQKARGGSATALKLEERRPGEHADPILLSTYKGWIGALKNPKPGARSVQLKRGWHTAFEKWAGAELGRCDLHFDKDSATYQAYFVKNQWWILDARGRPHAWS